MNEVVSGSVSDIWIDTESEPGQVTMNVGHGDYAGPAWLDAGDARKVAAALLRAADEAESGISEEARLRTELAAVDDELRKAGIEYPLGARGVRDLANLYEVAKEGD